jgi:hypothetical protein
VFDFSISAEGDGYVLHGSLAKNTPQVGQRFEGAEDIVDGFLVARGGSDLKLHGSHVGALMAHKRRQ